MTELRIQDKLFVAVLIPIAAVLLYVYGWRNDAAKRVATLAARERALVTVEEAPFETRQAERERTNAEQELTTEKAVQMPQAKVRGCPNAGVAERERIVLDVFRAAGLLPWRVESAEAEGDGGEALRATGQCPTPAVRAYVFTGAYAAVRRFLEALDAREMAVIVRSIEMREDEAARWSVTLWL